MRTRLLALVAGCTIAASWAEGCAQVVGLDEHFTERPDASSGTPGGDDDTGDDDATTRPGHDASLLDAATEAATVPPTSLWQIDETFGDAGWVVLDQPVGATYPVITGEDGGLLDLAASAADGGGVLLAVHVDPEGTAPTFATTPLAGAPGDMTVRDGSLFLLTNHSDAPGMSTTVSQTTLARFDEGATTPASTRTDTETWPGQVACAGRKIFTVADDRVVVLGDCAGTAYLPGAMSESGSMLFVGDSGTFSGQPSASGGPPEVVVDAVGSADGLWMVGWVNGQQGQTGYVNGIAALVQDDAGVVSADSYVPSRNEVISGGASTVASVVPQADGTAWVFGVFVGSFFLSQVPGVDGGVPSPGPNYFTGTRLPVATRTAQLQQAPTTRTQLIADSFGTRLLVGARADAPQVAVAVVAQVDGTFGFTRDFATTNYTVPGPAGVTALSVGGAVLVPAGGDDNAYVAATITYATGSQIGILRLHRHTQP